MAVGETCVDAERRRFNECDATWLQQRTAGKRSIARPLVSDVNRGAKATHGGIGLRDVHCYGKSRHAEVHAVDLRAAEAYVTHLGKMSRQRDTFSLYKAG